VPLAPSSEPLQPDLVEMLERLGARPGASVDLIIATGLFSHGASEARESALLRACRRVLKPGASLLATFPLQDDLGNPVTARNIQFLDAAERTGLQQSEILGCQGLAGFLEDAFWARLRSQGHAAFDAVFHSLTTVTDLPETLWMSSEALYIGDKV
jgi:hypothetical protein